jgi:hypothetical protein
MAPRKGRRRAGVGVGEGQKEECNFSYINFKINMN